MLVVCKTAKYKAPNNMIPYILRGARFLYFGERAMACMVPWRHCSAAMPWPIRPPPRMVGMMVAKVYRRGIWRHVRRGVPWWDLNLASIALAPHARPPG